MASSWGESWGLSWGNSWGGVTVEDEGGGGPSAKKKNKWYREKLEASREQYFKKTEVIKPEVEKKIDLTDEINELSKKAEELRRESEEFELSLEAGRVATIEHNEYMMKDEEDAISALLLSIYMDEQF